MPRAFTRAVSPRLAECELTHLKRQPVSAETAMAQHSGYEQSIANAGYEIVRLPSLDGHPDGVFVEDTAILLGDHAVITRPGAPSRAAETGSTAAGLSDHFELHRIEDGHVDGGDVLTIGKRIYVGLSSRTDAAGIAALKSIAANLDFEVIAADLRQCLHLKTGATFAGTDAAGPPLLLFDPRSVDPAQFADVEPLAVAGGEPAASNCVRAGDRLILPLGNPRTAARLRDRGFTVVEVDVSELQKAEAGVTCMSLIDDRP
jgi:dimethylargininase